MQNGLRSARTKLGLGPKEPQVQPSETYNQWVHKFSKSSTVTTLLIDLEQASDDQHHLQLTSFNICQALDPELPLGKNLVELNIVNLDVMEKLTRVAVEYATSADSSQSNYFVNTCNLFAEKQRIVKQLNPGAIRKLVLLGRLKEIQTSRLSPFEESCPDHEIEQLGSRVFCDNQVDKFADMMEELKFFDQLEHLEIQAPLPSDEVLDIAAEAITNKRRLKSLRLGFIVNIWQDWEDDSEFCMHETHDLFTSR